MVVIGAGPIGLTAALDFAAARHRDGGDRRQRHRFDRLARASATPSGRWKSGIASAAASRMVAKGVSWKVGKVFFRDRLSYQFDLLPETDHKMPAMINLQQYYLEEYLIDGMHGAQTASSCAGSTSCSA